jgi:hypothetical protein
MRNSFTILSLVLAACGGGHEESKPRSHMNTEPVTVDAGAHVTQPRTIILIPKDLPLSAELRAKKASPVLKPAVSEDPVFSIEDEKGTQSGSFALLPERGRGFPELKVTLTARTIGEASAPQPVRPTCRAANKCEYPLIRNYAVSLSDDAALQLVPRGDAVAIVARVMNVDGPKTVDVRFSVDDRVFSHKRIVLLSD